MFNLFFILENIREKNSIECSIDKTVYIYICATCETRYHATYNGQAFFPTSDCARFSPIDLSISNNFSSILYIFSSIYIINATMFNLFFALENIREKNSIECSIDKTVYIYTYALLAKHVTMQLTMDELFSQLIVHDFLLLISRSRTILPCIPFFISSQQYI